MATQLHKTVKGLTDAVLKTPAGTLLVLPTAAGGVFNPGQEVQEIEGSSRLGEVVILDTYAMGRKPTIKLDWKTKSLQLIGMQLGLSFEESTNVSTKVMSNGLRVTKNNYPEADIGFEGYGMIADQAESVAAYLSPGDLSVPLTRQAYGSFNAATPLSFAQGPNAGMKYSNDLIGKYVAYEFPQTLANAVKLTQNDFSGFSMRMMCITVNREILEWNFPSVSVKLEEGEINLAEPDMSLTFRVQDDGTDCVPYGVVYKGLAQRRKCA